MQALVALGQRASVLDGVLDMLVGIQITRHITAGIAVRQLLLVLILILGHMVVLRRCGRGQQSGGRLGL